MLKRNPHGKYVLPNGDEIYFSEATRASNGWWRVGDVSMGRSVEGENASKDLLVRETERLLSRADWPIPTKVQFSVDARTRWNQFGFQFKTVFGKVSVGISMRHKLFAVALPPGLTWHLNHKVTSDTFHRGEQAEQRFDQGELEKYLGDPLGYIAELKPGLEEFFPNSTGINFREEFEKKGNRQVGDYWFLVGPEDLIHLRGSYIKLARPAMEALTTLFKALESTGVGLQLRTSYHDGERVVEGIRVRIGENISQSMGGAEFESEPHEFNIGLDGVRVWCGYAHNTKKMEDYQKLLAAQELAGLADMFTDGPDTTTETSRTIEF